MISQELFRLPQALACFPDAFIKSGKQLPKSAYSHLFIRDRTKFRQFSLAVSDADRGCDQWPMPFLNVSRSQHHFRPDETIWCGAHKNAGRTVGQGKLHSEAYGALTILTKDELLKPAQVNGFREPSERLRVRITTSPDMLGQQQGLYNARLAGIIGAKNQGQRLDRHSLGFTERLEICDGQFRNHAGSIGLPRFFF